MEEGATGGQGIGASLRRLRQSLLNIAENRLDLLLLELHEARWQFVYSLLLTGLVFVLGLMTLLVPTLTIVVVCILAKRYDLLVGLTIVYLVATVVCGYRLRSCLKSWQPFSATVAELKKDKACLEEKS